jgi:hypothetical protein
LLRWPPEHRQQAQCAANSGRRGDDESDPARGIEDPDRVVDRETTGSHGPDREAGQGEGHDVFVALAGAEDEKAVPRVVGEPGDDHGADDAGGRKGRQEPDHEQRSRTELREAGQPGVQSARTHPQALEPTSRARDLPAVEDVIIAVRDHHEANSDAENQQPHVRTIYHTHIVITLI